MQWEFDKGRKFRKVVVAWRNGIRRPAWLWPPAINAVAKVHAHLFDTEGRGQRSRRNAWLPLAEMTSQMRERGSGYYSRKSGEGAEHRILHWTNRLRRGLADRGKGTGDSVRRTRGLSLTYGTRHPLAYKHHRGQDVPQRRVLDPEGARDAVVRVFQQRLVRWMNRGNRSPSRS